MNTSQPTPGTKEQRKKPLPPHPPGFKNAAKYKLQKVTRDVKAAVRKVLKKLDLDKKSSS